MNIDLDPDAVTDVARKNLLRLMLRTRDIFDGYFFEHDWTMRHDNAKRDYRSAMRQIRSQG